MSNEAEGGLIHKSTFLGLECTVPRSSFSRERRLNDHSESPDWCKTAPFITETGARHEAEAIGLRLLCTARDAGEERTVRRFCIAHRKKNPPERDMIQRIAEPERHE